jgi:SAM-dependent methyltransferase
VRIVVTNTRDEAGKFTGVVNALSEIWRGSILDVGSRSGNLVKALPDVEWQYYGLDLFPPAAILSNLESGLPFAENTFSTVVALDVLEHTNNIHWAFEELCRVSKKYIVITLPNCYEMTSRIRFLLGKPISGKYGLPINPPEDRHRWLFSWFDAQVFIKNLSSQYGFRVQDEICLLGPRRGVLPLRLFTKLAPNLFSPWYLVLLTRVEAT